MQMADWTVAHFALSNPKGRGMESVPSLVNRLATNIRSLGKVEILDITFHSQLTPEGVEWPSFVVYYVPAKKRSPSGAHSRARRVRGS
jgi:hypothetical protein